MLNLIKKKVCFLEETEQVSWWNIRKDIFESDAQTTELRPPLPKWPGRKLHPIRTAARENRHPKLQLI